MMICWCDVGRPGNRKLAVLGPFYFQPTLLSQNTGQNAGSVVFSEMLDNQDRDLKTSGNKRQYLNECADSTPPKATIS